MNKTIGLKTGVAIFALGASLCASSVYAQETVEATAADTSADAADGDAGTIIVTGSRIASTVPVSVAPVQVYTADTIQASGAINIQDVLLENPVFGAPTYSRTANQFSTSGAGIATVDLRNLGIDRTLVLVNGRRVVSGVPGSAAVDLNMIPTQMVERTEILTSGSGSAIYGSDAVAGVVNFILKDDFEGVELNAQTGLAETGDNFQLDTGVLLGKNFGGGRGNVTAFLGYSEQGSAFLRNHRTEAGSSAVDSISEVFFGGNLETPVRPYLSGYAPQGRYFSDNYTWTYGPSGALQPCASSNEPTCNSEVRDENGNIVVPGIGTGTGPNGFNRSQYRYLAIPIKRYTANLNAKYDLTDNITAFFEGSYLRTDAKSSIEAFPWDTESGDAYPGGQMPIETLYNGVIYANPYVPAPIFADASDTDGDGLRDIYVTKRLTDFGPRASKSKQENYRFVGGLRGNIATDWTFEVFGNYGRADVVQTGTGQINVPHFIESQKIVPNGSGGFMCASAQARAEGCVPANLFGLGSLAPAVDYLSAPSRYDAYQEQIQAGGNIGGLIANPLGARQIGVTVGVEYRREKQASYWDELQTLGLNGGNALPPTRGKFDVKEAYGEVLLPLVSEGFVHDLSVRGAVRVSDYSTVGTTFSWNAGAEFAPIPDVRFRGMYAVTVRAPNIGELYAGISQDFPQVNDPCVGIEATGGGAKGDNCRAAPGVLANIAASPTGKFQQTQADLQGTTSFSGGNPNLGEEKGKTLTLGMVVNPRSVDALRNLTLSVDYFRVNVKDAIVSTPLDFILDQCYNAGVQSFCDFVVRRPAAIGANSAGSLDEVNSGVTNSGGLRTSGIDVALNYLHTFNLGNTALKTTFNVAYTHLLTGSTTPLPGSPKDRFKGEIGAARDRFTVNTSVGTDQFRLSATGTYIGKSWVDDQFDGYHAYSISPEFYLDLQARFYTKSAMEFYVGVDNVFDNDPAYFAGIPDATTGMETNTAVYDPFGRRFYAGARLKF